ncbi:transposase [Streptomyces rhizosphaericus]|uniref:transposase n=1 Tax=Streptomyces rhizosphaericus TaxID=114699 RepID=UPI0035D47C67
MWARFHKITLVWADGGYTGGLVTWVREKLQLTLQIVKRSDDMDGFVVLPRRWVVERTLGWLMRSRRLVRDFETLRASSEAFIYFSQAMLMSRRLVRPASRRRQDWAAGLVGTRRSCPPGNRARRLARKPSPAGAHRTAAGQARR